jgi:hypothetical protein
MKPTIIAAAVGAIVALGLAAGIVAYHRTTDTLVVVRWHGGDQ